MKIDSQRGNFGLTIKSFEPLRNSINYSRMNKNSIIKVFINELEREFQTIAKSAMDAREEATSEETKPENEYDTRGLEASYLAGAQAKRANEIKDQIQKMRLLNPKDYTNGQPVGPTALVEAEIDGSEKRNFFMIPFEGGKPIEVDGQTVIVLSLNSPLGQELNNQKVGHAFSLKVKDNEREYEILSIL